MKKNRKKIGKKSKKNRNFNRKNYQEHAIFRNTNKYKNSTSKTGGCPRFGVIGILELGSALQLFQNINDLE